MEALEPLAGEELERLLARYARVRLEPSQALTRRARGAVMEAAWRRRLDPQSILRADPPDTAAAADAVGRGSTRRVPFTGWGHRRVGVAFAAATLAGLLLGSSVFAASRAGGPLYESRLALESLTLPADRDGRVAAQLEHAEARLGEAVDAGLRHDDRAIAAALDAYDRAIEDVAGATGNAADEAVQAIQFHRTVLLELATEVPPAAAPGIQTALESGNRVIVTLAGSGAAGGGTGGTTPGAPQGNGFGANGGNAAGGQGAGQGGGSTNGAGGGGANGTNNGNAIGANNGGANNGNGGNAPATTPAPTEHPARPTPRPTVAPTPSPTSKPNAGPHGSHDPASSSRPHATDAQGEDSPASSDAPNAGDGPAASRGDQP